MSEADEIKSLISSIAVELQAAVGDGAAAESETNRAVLGLIDVLTHLRNARVHSLQKIGRLREHILPKADILFNDTLDSAASDAIVALHMATQTQVDYANFLQRKIDHLERQLPIIGAAKRDLLMESAAHTHRAANAITDTYNKY